MNQRKIRRYREPDYEDVYNIWKRAGIKLGFSDTKDEITKLANHNQDSFFVLENENIIIGAVVAAYDGRRGYIHHLAVDPQYQGNGYGKQLMDKAMEYYASINCVKVHLMVEECNKQVISFYKHLGWHLRGDIILMSYAIQD